MRKEIDDMNETILCERIAALRREAGFTQEQLAQRLGVSFQAASKWENALSCPDIMLLPAIADIFHVSIDSLFGREAQTLPVPAPEDAPRPGDALPWDADAGFYAVLYRGHELIFDRPLEENDPRQRITFEWEGPVDNLCSAFGVKCDQVYGNVEAGGDVSCDSVLGHVSAGGNVSCDGVAGSVSAGGNVSCDGVAGSVSAGGTVDCGGAGGVGDLDRRIETMVDDIIGRFGNR